MLVCNEVASLRSRDRSQRAGNLLRLESRGTSPIGINHGRPVTPTNQNRRAAWQIGRNPFGREQASVLPGQQPVELSRFPESRADQNDGSDRYRDSSAARQKGNDQLGGKNRQDGHQGQDVARKDHANV